MGKIIQKTQKADPGNEEYQHFAENNYNTDYDVFQSPLVSKL